MNPRDEPLGHRIVATERMAEGFRPLDRITVRHASPTGGEDITARLEILRARPAAVVIPYDAARDRIVVVRQFRIGAALAGADAAPLELPAGLLDPGEDARTAALRELAEETGLYAQVAEEAFTILSSPGLTDEVATMFLALVDAGDLPQSTGLAGEHEDIVPLAFPADDLVRAADEGHIRNGFLFASLQWFARKGRERARSLLAR